MRQLRKDFEQFASEAADGLVGSQWITEEPFEHLEGFKALDGNVSGRLARID